MAKSVKITALATRKKLEYPVLGAFPAAHKRSHAVRRPRSILLKLFTYLSRTSGP